jgi:hypothetical protein
MYYSLYHWTRWLLPLASVAVMCASSWEAIQHPMGRILLARFAAAAYTFALAVLVIQVTIFLLCLRLSFRRNAPIRWSRYEAGILIGFGLAAIASLPIYLTRFRFGPAMELAYRYLPPVAYMAAVLIWLGAFWRVEPPLARKPTDPELFKRAAAFMRRAVEEAEKDLELRSHPLVSS